MYIDLFLAREPSAGQEKSLLRSQAIMLILGSELRSLQKAGNGMSASSRGWSGKQEIQSPQAGNASVCISWIQFVQKSAG